MVNRVETDRETIFFNSPDANNADIVHEIVPEIKAAKQVFERPGTVEKFRQVSQQMKSVDEAVITRRKSLMPHLSAVEPSTDKRAAEVNDSPASVNISTLEESHATSTKTSTGFEELHPNESHATPQSESQSVESAPKDDKVAKSESAQKETALNISILDTPTTILSRNVMYKDEEVQETSSDSSSSESDANPGEGVLSKNGNPEAAKWRLSDVFYCCWSRR